MNIYEGMFVLDDRRANDNWDGVVAEVRGLLEKHQARILNLERWDERRLAYRIKGRGRAVYMLTRFMSNGEAIGPIERDCQLSDTILRVLFLRDHDSEKQQKLGLFDPEALLAQGGVVQPVPKPQATPSVEDAAPAPAQPEAEDASHEPTPEPPTPQG